MNCKEDCKNFPTCRFSEEGKRSRHCNYYIQTKNPQAAPEAVSAELALLCCPFCGEEIRPFRTYRMKWAVVHSCESGLKIEISSRKKKEVLEILAKRAT